jgi:hypothetical protein
VVSDVFKEMIPVWSYFACCSVLIAALLSDHARQCTCFRCEGLLLFLTGKTLVNHLFEIEVFSAPQTVDGLPVSRASAQSISRDNEGPTTTRSRTSEFEAV